MTVQSPLIAISPIGSELSGCHAVPEDSCCIGYEPSAPFIGIEPCADGCICISPISAWLDGEPDPSVGIGIGMVIGPWSFCVRSIGGIGEAPLCGIGTVIGVVWCAPVVATWSREPLLAGRRGIGLAVGFLLTGLVDFGFSAFGCAGIVMPGMLMGID